jgi:hypothetical protein
MGLLKPGTNYLQKRWGLSLVNLERVRKAIINGVK